MELWSHFGFVFPVFAGIYLFGIRARKRKLFYVRFLSGFLVTFLIMLLMMTRAVNLTIDAGCNELQVLSVRVSFALLVYLLGLATTILSYDCDFFVALCLVTCGYCLQHFCRVLVNILLLLFPEGGRILEVVSLCVIWILVYGGLYLFYIRPRRKREIVVEKRAQLIIATLPILFSIVLNSFGNIYIDSKIGKLIFNFYIALIAALAIIIEQLMSSGKEAEMQKATMEKMFKESKEQFLFEKHLIDLVNIKAHDLKHQVNETGKVNQNTTKEVNQLVDEYDSSFNTGSKALDIVLTRKSRECHRHGIVLTCMAEGKALDGFEEAQIYSLFGNILDNAIEASRKIPDKGKRVVTLTVKMMGDFILIHQSNYYQEEFEMKDGLPVTTKPDRDYHGYGMKSIKAFCDEHDGQLKIEAENHIFSLDILLVEPKKEA